MVKVEDDPLELVSSRYEAWRDSFTTERDRIREVLNTHDLDNSVKRIEHVGSTSIPNLAAKNIVDLNIVVTDAAVSEVSRKVKAVLGGDRVENTALWHPVFREEDGQRFNDHVFAASSDGWKISVITRDVLRVHPDLRTEYEELKYELTAEHDNLVTYSEGKTTFIKCVLDVARTDDSLTFDFAIPTL